MDKRPETKSAKVKRLRAWRQAVTARRIELRLELHTIYRELSDLSSRSLRRRRYGDV